MENDILEKARKWISEKYDETTSAQLQDWINKSEDKLIEKAFDDSLLLGYDGWRKPYGPGVGNFNAFSIARITQAFINYLRKEYPGEKIQIVIGYDGRKNNTLYAQEVAKVISSNDHLAWYFPLRVPTSMLSFFIREKKCKAGIMITASDDSAEMNGLKLFGADGAQLKPEGLNEIINETNTIEGPADIPQKENCGLIRFVPETYEDAFIQMAANLMASFTQGDTDLKIVYSPLYGNGVDFIPDMLERAGFKNVFQVAGQSEADEQFSGIEGKPSPENINAYQLAIQLAANENADICILSDPDCDKFGIACKSEKGDFEILTSNEAAVLLWDFLLSKNSITDNKTFVVKSIVATPLLSKIADYYGVECIETAPEFSSVISALDKLVTNTNKQFIAAADLNMALLFTDKIMDKDAVTTVGVMIALANTLKNTQTSLLRKLTEIYHQHGYYYEESFKVDVPGTMHFNAIDVFNNLKREPPKLFSYIEAGNMDDYTSGQTINLKNNLPEPLEVPKFDLISLTIVKGRIFVYPVPAMNQLQCIVHIWRDPITDFDNYKIICEGKAAVIRKELTSYINKLHEEKF